MKYESCSLVHLVQIDLFNKAHTVVVEVNRFDSLWCYMHQTHLGALCAVQGSVGKLLEGTTQCNSQHKLRHAAGDIDPIEI